MKKQMGLNRKSSRLGLPIWTLALMAVGALSPAAQAQLQKAGDLLVNVDSTGLGLGPVLNLPNAGTLGGFFVATGTEADRPTVGLVGGTKAMVFDGTDFLRLADTSDGTSLINAPAGLVGPNPTRSIEVWTLNPQVANEETLVSWGKRGGPDGSNVSFGYGSDFRWGAIGHWGGDGPDTGWNNDGGNPTPNKWHHLVYTFDGTTTRVYVDGALGNAEVVAADTINTHPDTSINIATQLEADGLTPTGGLRYTGAIARVRVHDEVLTGAQVLANYTLEKADFTDPQPPPPIEPARLTKGPVHRYSFGETATANATDKEFKDSVGTAHGTAKGEGASFSGSRLVLAGGPSATAAYGDLPNGLISSQSKNKGGSGAVTLETWMKVTGGRTWSRIFDVGSSTAPDDNNEVFGPGGGGTGLDYLALSAQIGDDTGSRRLEIRNEDPAGGGVVTADSSTQTFGRDFHVAVTWDETTGRITLFENGKEVAGLTTDDPMSDLNDVNVWLGRSNWNGDQNTQGEYDEVRIYDYALSVNEALGNALAGPDLLNDRDIPVTIAAGPASQAIPETLPVTFSVTYKGSTPISFQWLRNGEVIPGATGNTYTVAAVSSADSGASFAVKVSNGSGATATTVTSEPAVLTVIADTVTLKHRYSFNEASGTGVDDSVGNADGTVEGTATFGDGKLTLDGGESFVNLPNGIISALGNNGTIETWFTYDGGPNWTRVFDFGTRSDGENGEANGLDYLFFTPKTAQGFGRFIANFPDGGDTTVLSTPGSTPIGQEFHLAIAYSFTGNTCRVYTNGTLVATGPAPKRLSELTADVNNWLGKSQFPGDSNIAGKYNEFRIYQGAMTPNQVAASYAAGPNTLPPSGPPPPATIQRLGSAIVITWPSSEAGLKLEGTDSLQGPVTWTPAGDGTPIIDGKFRVELPAAGSARFLRLRR